MKTFRIGNGYKIWHYSGSLIHEKLFSPPDELWETDWQSALPESIPPFKISKQLVSGIQTTQPQVSFCCIDQPATGQFLVYRTVSHWLVAGIQTSQLQVSFCIQTRGRKPQVSFCIQTSQPQVCFWYTDQPAKGQFLVYSQPRVSFWNTVSHRLVSSIQISQSQVSFWYTEQPAICQFLVYSQPRGGRLTTTISRPSHILFPFSSEPPKIPRSSSPCK